MHTFSTVSENSLFQLFLSGAINCQEWVVSLAQHHCIQWIHLPCVGDAAPSRWCQTGINESHSVSGVGGELPVPVLCQLPSVEPATLPLCTH